MEKKLKSSISLRGDSLYCPLSLSLDSYGNCLTDCHHCYLRNLNHVWGQELKPADLDLLDQRLYNGLRNKTPQQPISHALSAKKTIRWGNKTDPFQEAEKTYRISKQIFPILYKYEWTYVIQTRFTHILAEYESRIIRANKKNLITIMPVISPGLDKDWEIFERSRTTPPLQRLKQSRLWSRQGIPVGINGEPFIPGFHTVKDFEDTLKLLKGYGVKSYNTYNFHFNAYVAKRLCSIGVDIEKIWFYNQDSEWKKILAELLPLTTKYGINLGCPDFVNTGKDWNEPANTCCGVQVANPCTFNSHHFKLCKQAGMTDEETFQHTWDGTGNREEGIALINGTNSKMYNLKDAGL